jgi:hypothetical protein
MRDPYHRHSPKTKTEPRINAGVRFSDKRRCRWQRYMALEVQ